MSQSEALTPVLYNVTITDANTEYSQVIGVRAKHFEIQNRAAVDIRVAFVTGKVATPTAPYLTVKSGTTYRSPEKMGWSGTIFVASGTASQTAEIIAWLALA